MKKVIILLCAWGFLASSAIAQEEPDHAEWEALAKTLQPNASQKMALPPLDISFSLDIAGGLFSDERRAGGAHDPNRTGFNFQQLEVAIGSNVDPFFRLDGNLVFSPFGVEIEEVYASTLALPAGLQVRAGQFLTRYGRLNSTHLHAWDFLDQPFLLTKFFGGEGNRGLGLEIAWLTPLPWYAEWITAVTDGEGEATSRSFWGGKSPGVHSPADFQYTTVLKQFFPITPDHSFAWGLSAALGPNPTGRDNRTEVYGTDLYLKYRPLNNDQTAITWTLEAMTRRRQIPADILVDQGLYSTLTWQWDKQWSTAARYEIVSGLASDPLDPDWTGSRQRLSTALTYRPTEFSRLRLQGSGDWLNWQPQPVYGLVLGLEVMIGAHAAHRF